MNSRDTGCLGVAAALALSALAGDAWAEEAVVSRAPALRAARPSGAKVARDTKAQTRLPPMSSMTRPPLSRSVAASGFDVAARGFDAAVLTPPEITPVAPAPVVSAARPSTPLAEHALGDTRLPQGEPAPSSSPAKRTPSDGTPAQPEGGADALAAAERLLGDGVPLELFQSVIMPAARGVTIAEIPTEGALVTVSVRPTKITRGSGLVAVGQF